MIESLHSPHIVRVKALLGSKGTKERRATGEFVAEGMQCIREALISRSGPKVQVIYLTHSGREKIEAQALDISLFVTHEVSEAVMQAMATTITPQGILSICSKAQPAFSQLELTGHSRIVYLQEIQDPGNAGTILRAADAIGAAAVITSPGSVDFYSPKVVRATAGSLWHIPIFEGIELATVVAAFPSAKKIALIGSAATSMVDVDFSGDVIAIFGNEARGLDIETLAPEIDRVRIPMRGRAESLNLSAAAAIVLFHLSNT